MAIEKQAIYFYNCLILIVKILSNGKRKHVTNTSILFTITEIYSKA